MVSKDLIIELVKRFNDQYIIEDQDKILDNIPDHSKVSEGAQLMDDMTHSTITEILDFFKEKGIDVYPEIDSMKDLNYNKVKRYWHDYNQFKDLTMEEFGWFDKNDLSNKTASDLEFLLTEEFIKELEEKKKEEGN